jgi:hypothetical protein
MRAARAAARRWRRGRWRCGDWAPRRAERSDLVARERVRPRRGVHKAADRSCCPPMLPPGLPPGPEWGTQRIQRKVNLGKTLSGAARCRIPTVPRPCRPRILAAAVDRRASRGALRRPHTRKLRASVALFSSLKGVYLGGTSALCPTSFVNPSACCCSSGGTGGSRSATCTNANGAIDGCTVPQNRLVY